MKPQAAQSPRPPLVVSCDRCRTNRADYRWVAASMAAHKARAAPALCGPCVGSLFGFLANGRLKAQGERADP
jgi:hypothetical protein